MIRILAMVSAVCALGLGLQAYAAPTMKSCAADYDKCKNKVEHMFDKKPCQKDRAVCEQQVNKVAKATVKNRMLNGETRDDRRGGNMRDWEREDSKEAARRRLEERAERNGSALPVDNSSASMRDRMNTKNDSRAIETRDSKAEALRRMKERQRAQGTKPADKKGGSMRDAVKTTN